jgi:molybdate transport system substrate-binding protein
MPCCAARVLALLLLVLPSAHPGAQPASVPTLAAAADLQFAVPEIARRFQAQTGLSVKLSFGSSGNFYQQIARGAPFELFMSADEGFVYKLADAGRTEDRGVLYAVGRIVVIAPHGSSLKADASLEGLARALKEKRIRRFAIANPEHAPYGRAAEQALRKLKLWDALKAHLVFGENVSQAAQFATSGSAEGGIIAYSLALAPAVSKLGSFALLPEDLHDPLRQRMVLVKGAGETAKRFYDYIQGPSAREVLKRYGFVLPGE